MHLIPHNTWKIHDANKIQAYMDCPRAYFFEFVLGWKPEKSNIHLEFGTAIHIAQEHLLLHGYGDVSVLGAYTKLHTYYRQFFPDILDDANHPKTPAMALKALMEYVIEYKREEFKVLYTEIAGTVSLTDRIVLHFRMDSILETADGIKSREHKTGSQLSRPWTDQWALKVQTGVYNHVLYCIFPPEKVWGVEINGIIFGKKNIQFVRVPARRTLQSMEVWYWNTIEWIEEIEEDFKRLELHHESDVVMKCFKMNTENCTKYFGCKYHDFCIAWPNPIARADELPLGFKVEYWDPSSVVLKAKQVFNITQQHKEDER